MTLYENPTVWRIGHKFVFVIINNKYQNDDCPKTLDRGESTEDTRWFFGIP